MKFLLAITIFILTPVILCAFLFSAALPLFIRHFFKPKAENDKTEYPYLTSWEEAA